MPFMTTPLMSILHLFALVLSLSTSCQSLKQQAHHDGKAHHHPRPRSTERGHVEHVSDSITSSDNIPLLSMRILVPKLLSPDPIFSPAPTIRSYSFPSTVIQIPITTICPSEGRQIENALNLITSSIVSPLNNTRFSPENTTAVNHTGLPFNGTSLSSNNTMGNNTTVTITSVIPMTAAARILLGSGGCMTIYSPTTTAICSTTLRFAGQPDVTISSCGQWIPFSTRTNECSIPITNQADPSAMTERNTIYAAHWYDLAQNGVPGLVMAQACDSTDNDFHSNTCQTHTEVWRMTTTTSQTTTTSIASFSGVSTNFSNSLPMKTLTILLLNSQQSSPLAQSS